MEFKLDQFNGIIIDPISIPNNENDFASQLASIVQFSSQNKKGITWITLPIESSNLIKFATELGFIFHNCLEHEITLIHRAESVEFVPFIPTHTLGAGALITNDNNQVLVIREQGRTEFKLPGGHIELAEEIAEAVVRETYEETGIKARFESVVGMATRHPYQFGKSNLYFVCRLTALSYDISIQDTDEIAEAKWIDINEYIHDENTALFNRQLVSSLVTKDGLALTHLDKNHGVYSKHEVFFSQSELS
ncbi:NUDIX domain-containing protein [Vibrio makurazakiensis]|uniref:NUDIX domain-containing protein n=1 Tax=Vibrio makurazakiensis TaxID=2910250 RepID=UPI003D0DA4BA